MARGLKAGSPKGEVVVLRYGHRAVRDYRVTSHCCLVARAFGAKRIIIAGEADPEIKQSVDGVTAKWGGKFEVQFTDSWRETITGHKKKGFACVHTTMYGLRLQDEIKRIRKRGKVLLILGSQKVERAVYEMADFNVAITSQPHSEIAALAVFLHEYFQGKGLGLEFKGAKTKITPEAHGKNVRKAN
ncbi:MAG: tRNA (cytidine(56)-2'-O)-methyltransferase [Candidatus Diapherotrites archaeon]